MTFNTKVYDYPYLDIRVSDDLDYILKYFIKIEIINHIERGIKSELFTKYNSLKYFCFRCGDEIHVNILDNITQSKPIIKKNFLCDEHKQEKISDYSLSFLKYETEFYKQLQLYINKL